MKRSSLVLFVVALIAAASLTLIPTQQPASAAEKGEELHEAMEVLGGQYKALRRQVSDSSKNADSAERLGLMLEASYTAKKHMPETASTDDLKKSYRVMMNKMIIALSEAENAALQGDQDKLKLHFDALKDIKDGGHALFLSDDDE